VANAATAVTRNKQLLHICLFELAHIYFQVEKRVAFVPVSPSSVLPDSISIRQNVPSL